MCRFCAALAAGLFFGLLAVPAAIGKESVHARLDTSVPLEAAPGKTITIAWTLSYAGRGSRRPFGCFRRLCARDERLRRRANKSGRPRAGGRPLRRQSGGAGRGIGAIKIGLEGTRFIGGRSENADVFFPIDNDPFAAPDAAVGNAPDSRSSAPTADAGQPLLVWLAAAGALAALGAVLTFHRARALRRRPGGTSR